MACCRTRMGTQILYSNLILFFTDQTLICFKTINQYLDHTCHFNTFHFLAFIFKINITDRVGGYESSSIYSQSGGNWEWGGNSESLQPLSLFLPFFIASTFLNESPNSDNITLFWFLRRDKVSLMLSMDPYIIVLPLFLHPISQLPCSLTRVLSLSQSLTAIWFSVETVLLSHR